MKNYIFKNKGAQDLRWKKKRIIGRNFKSCWSINCGIGAVRRFGIEVILYLN